MLEFDFETTNHSYGSALDQRNRILMVAWCVGSEPVQRYCGDIMEAKQFWKDVNEAKVLSAYNCKFEMHWFKRLGLDIDRWTWHDPMLAERVLQGNRRVPLSLGAVAQRYGLSAKDPVIDSMMRSGICPSDMPQKRLLARCVRDVETTRALRIKQIKRLTKSSRLHLYRTRCEFARVLCHMEANGMLLDVDRVNTAYDEARIHRALLRQELDALTGGINLRSPDQLAKFLYHTLKFPEKKGAGGKPLRNKPSKQFPNGRPKTDKHTMAWLAKAAKTDEQKLFIQLRQDYGKVDAELSKNLEFFKGVCDERGGYFYAQFNQTIAATHRLTSSGLPLLFKQYDKEKSTQLQNMPRLFKRLFVAPDGYSVVEVDAAQLEFRVAAFCGQDEQAMADIQDPDFDAHCKSASVMNDLDYDGFLFEYRAGSSSAKILRQEAKADTFKPLYGGTKGTPEQERWYKAFQERYSDLYSTQEHWVSEVARNGELVLPWGMRFYWDVHHNRRGVLLDKHSGRPVGPQVFNYPVQSLATAEMMPIAITALYDKCKEKIIDVKFVNTVHDSVIVYCSDNDLDKFKEICKWAFTTAVRDHLELFYGIDFNVPLGCGFTPGKHWGEGEESIYDEVEGS